MVSSCPRRRGSNSGRYFEKGWKKAFQSGYRFLKNKANIRLKEALQEGTLDKQEFYRQVLRLVYRLVFLFMAEERNVLTNPVSLETAKTRYWKDHAARRLRNLSSKKNQSMYGDMWKGLVR